jgi:hypothetical protein
MREGCLEAAALALLVGAAGWGLTTACGQHLWFSYHCGFHTMSLTVGGQA